MSYKIVLIAALSSFIFLSCTYKDNGPYRTALLGKVPKKFDPIGLHEFNHTTVMNQVCGRLTVLDEGLVVKADIADFWDVSKDLKEYIFHINKERKFPSGESVTANDVKFSLERVSKHHGSIASTWSREISYVKVVDNSTIKIVLKKGNPRFLYTLTHPSMCILNERKPFYKIKKIDIPNSPGAYSVKDISTDSLILIVNDDFKKIAVEKEIEVSFLSQKNAIDKFKKGQLHDLSFYLLEDSELNEFGDDVRILNSMTYWTWILSLNPNSKIFNDPKMREVFKKNFPVDKFIKEWGSSINRGKSLIPYGMKGHVSDTNPEIRDMSNNFKCNKMIKVVGINGIPFSSRIPNVLKRIIKNSTGCSSEVKMLDMGEYMSAKANKSFDIYFHAVVTNSNDPIGYYRHFIKSQSENFLGFDNDKLNEKYNYIRSLRYSLRKKEDYVELHELAKRTNYQIVIGYPNFKFAYHKDVIKRHMNPLGMHLNRWFMIGRE